MLSISELRIMRKRLGLTQQELARLAGVSQGLIARIESGTVDPRYSTLKKIMDTLEGKKSEVLLAENIMNKPVEYVLTSDKVRKVIELMKRKKISQVPVLERGIMVGFIGETTLLNKYGETKSMKKMEEMRVREIMDAPLPTVSPKESFENVQVLLNEKPAVIVMDKGFVSGIITKADILKLK